MSEQEVPAATGAAAVRGPGMGPEAYENKPAPYFEGAQADYVDERPADPTASISELGCSRGGTRALALKKRKRARYVGVELDPVSAEMARQHLSQGLAGDIQSMDLPFDEESFDSLILSEVLEHLVEPWSDVENLARFVKPGGFFSHPLPTSAISRSFRTCFGVNSN